MKLKIGIALWIGLVSGPGMKDMLEDARFDVFMFTQTLQEHEPKIAETVALTEEKDEQFWEKSLEKQNEWLQGNIR